MIPEETTPKMKFYLSLPSEADMPTILADFYKQDMKREVLTPSDLVWSYDMTDYEYQAYLAAEEVAEEVAEDDVDPRDFITIPSGVTVTSYGPNDAGTLTLTQWTPVEYGENMIPDGEPYLVTDTKDYSLDVVGLIYKPTGNMLTDSEGNEYPEQAPIDGWHVNIKLARDIPNKDADDPEAVDTLRDKLEALDAIHGANPATPDRVWL